MNAVSGRRSGGGNCAVVVKEGVHHIKIKMKMVMCRCGDNSPGGEGRVCVGGD